eukprot:scaffold77347_cov56-Phaeocystis_antarctica.AAC.3
MVNLAASPPPRRRRCASRARRRDGWRRSGWRRRRQRGGARRRARVTPPPCRPAQCSKRKAPSRPCHSALSSRRRRSPLNSARRLLQHQGGSRRQTGARVDRRRGWALGWPTPECEGGRNKCG